MFEDSELTNTRNDLLSKLSDCAENNSYILNQYISVENFKTNFAKDSTFFIMHVNNKKPKKIVKN